MSTTTSNLSLIKPDSNENVDISVINGNYDKIDEFAGGTVSATLSSPANGQILKYNSTTGKFENANNSYNLSELGDTNITSPTEGQILQYNATTNRWENKTGGSSGSTVVWDQIQATGTKIATVSIDGVSTDVYAPEGGGGFTPTGETYRFITTGTPGSASYELDVVWTDGSTTESRVICDFTNIISGWTTGDYKNITVNWDRTNSNFNFVSKSGYFEYDDDYFAEGDTITTLTSGDITFEVVEPESGSDVSWTQVQLTGTKIAEIEIDGVSTNVYTPSVPTNTSDLTNDSNFVADATYVHTDNNYTTTEKNKLSGLVAVEANPSGTASTDLTKLAIGGVNYNIPSGGSGSSTFAGLSDVDIDDTTLTDGQVPVWNSTTEKWENGAGGGGTTVVANPSGEATDELEKLQVGNTIYSLPTGSGGGFTKVALYEISGTTPESVITLSQSIENFDLIEVVSLYGHTDGEDYKNTTVFNAAELIDSIGAARPKNWWVGNDSAYVWFYVTGDDEFTIHSASGQTGLGIWYVYGYKFSGGSGGSAEWTDIVGTLEAGDTEISFASSKIKTDSVIDVYSSVVGLDYLDITIQNHSCTVLFDEQETDVDVLLRVTTANLPDINYDIPLNQLIENQIWYYWDYAYVNVSEGNECLTMIEPVSTPGSWTAFGAIGIDLQQYDIPSNLSAIKVHFKVATLNSYTAVRFMNSDTLYSGSQSGNDAMLRINGFYQWMDQTSPIVGIDELDYTLTIPCTAQDLSARYLYIMAADGMIQGTTTGYSNGLEGTFYVSVDGIIFVTGGN